MNAGAQTFGPSFVACLGHWQGAGSKMKDPGYEPALVWVYIFTGDGRTHYATVQTPRYVFKQEVLAPT